MRDRAVWSWLALVVILLAAGFAIGWWSSSDTDADRARWDARTDSLLTSALVRHRAVLDSVAAAVTAAERRVSEAERTASRERAQATAARASETTLRRQLEAAASAVDSLRVYPGLVAAVTRRAEHAEAESSSLAVALAEQKAVTAGLRTRIATDSTRILDLEGQLARVPKPKAACRIGPVRCPVAVVGLGVTTGTGTAAGVSVTVGIPIGS